MAQFKKRVFGENVSKEVIEEFKKLAADHKVKVQSWPDHRGTELSEDIRVLLSEKYMELYKVLIGDDYNPSLGDVNTRIINNLTAEGLLKENVNEG